MPHSEARSTVSSTSADATAPWSGCSRGADTCRPAADRARRWRRACPSCAARRAVGVPACAGADHDYVVGVAHPESKSTAVLHTGRGGAPIGRVRCGRMDDPGGAQALAARGRARRLGRQARPVRRAGTCRSSTRARSPSTGRSASGSGCSISRTSARSRSTGPGALALLQGVVTNDVARDRRGGGAVQPRAQRGRGRDRGPDRLPDAATERYFVVPNASNTQRVLQILGEAEAPDRVHLHVPPGLVLPGRPGPELSPAIVETLFPEAGGPVVHAVHGGRRTGVAR